MTKSEFLGMKYSNIISDPFPDLSFKQSSNLIYSWLDRWALSRVKDLGYPNPWKAWKQGYDAAYTEMERKLVKE